MGRNGEGRLGAEAPAAAAAAAVPWVSVHIVFAELVWT